MTSARLIEANEAQQLARDAHTWAAWGAGLTVEQFRVRERRLREHPWAARTLKSYWWVSDAGEPLSSCELFVDAAQHGETRGRVGTVASVFTEEKHRGHGYAGAMLDSLSRMAGEGQGEGQLLALTLFSEIGLGLYSRLGYFAVPSFDTFFSPIDDAPSAVELLNGPLPCPRSTSVSGDALLLHVTPERLDWHLERERIYGEALGKPRLDFHGAKFGDASITFTAYWKTNELQVLTLDARTEDEATKLLGAARYAAKLAQLPTVRVWETDGLTARLPDATRRERTDEIPMFKPLVPGLQTWTRVERGLWA